MNIFISKGSEDMGDYESEILIVPFIANNSFFVELDFETVVCDQA